jgi:Uma2 family endonuclease
MAATIMQKKVTLHAVTQKYISWEDFQRKILGREDKYKYEWLNGVVEKTNRNMDYKQLFIAKNLIVLFRRLINSGKTTGELMTEGDIFFLENHRRPDMFFMTEKQLAYTAYGENQVPAFLVEIVSGNDNINKLVHKMQNFRAAGVEVVWHIFPEHEEVHVYSGTHLDTMLVCKGEDICTAASIITDFSMSVNDIFKKPAKPE